MHALSAMEKPFRLRALTNHNNEIRRWFNQLIKRTRTHCDLIFKAFYITEDLHENVLS